MIGDFARSKAGHDKDRIYVIIEETQEFVWLCDGDLRSLEKLKKKNKRHVQPIKKISDELRDCCMQNGHFYNEGIKRAIKEYRISIKEEA